MQDQPGADAAPDPRPAEPSTEAGSAAAGDAPLRRAARRRRMRRLVLLGLGLLLPLVVEGALRARHLKRKAPRDRDSWHAFDATLGWRNLPGWQGEGTTPGPEPLRFAVRTNAQGWRAGRDYARERRPGVRRVCVVGDSYVFGYGCAEEDGLVPRLERLLGAEVEVLGLGTCAFGLDQLRLVVEREALAYRPDVVVLCVITQSFRRALRAVSNTGHRKPRYLLEGDGVRLVGVPVPEPPPEGALFLADGPPDGGSFLLWELSELGVRARVLLAGGSEEARPRWRLGRALLLDAARVTRAAGATPVVALLPEPKALEEGEPLRPLLAALGPELSFLDCYPPFERAPDRARLFLLPKDPHPSPGGHALLAEALAAHLRAAGLVPPRPGSR